MSSGRKGGERFDPVKLTKVRQECKHRRLRKKLIFAEEREKQRVERPTVYLVKGPDGQWIPDESRMLPPGATPGISAAPPWLDEPLA